jgi:hypothetical protein
MVSAVSTPQPRASGRAGLERRPGQAALAVQRLGRLPADRAADAGPGQADDQAVPAELDGRGEDGDGHVGPIRQYRIGQRAGLRGRLGQVRVEEQQVPGAFTALSLVDQAHRVRAALHRGRLAPVAGVPQHHGARAAGHRAGSVAGTVVDDHDEADAGQPGRRRHGLADAIGFVPRRDDHRDVIALGPC